MKRDQFLYSIAMGSAGILVNRKLFRQDSRQIYDVVVYGASSSGVIAAVKAARLGRTVILIEPSHHLGGLTTGGLGATDTGLERAIGGMSLEFYRRIREHYRSDSLWRQESRDEYIARSGRYLHPDSEGMFGFEPHAARAVYEQMLREERVPVMMNERLVLGSNGVEKRSNKITAIHTESGNTYRGRIFIDATYEGDLLAMAGVSFHVGRESNARYDEELNGVQPVRTSNHIFPGFVDPYIEPGNRRSGLVPEVHDQSPGVEGEGDDRLQAYCFRMCLTDSVDNQIPFEKPQGYEELQYELLFRNYEAGETRGLPMSTMPNRKTDTNNRWGFSTNYIGGNYNYPSANYGAREEIIELHAHYQKGLMWTLANHPRVPDPIRNEIGRWGLSADEFTDNHGWPTQIYVREARRMIGEYVMTEHDCRRLRLANDSVGLGSYTMDSHNVQRYVTQNGCVQNEGNIEVSPRGPYQISYRSLLPKRNECANLLVSCNGVSASHIAFGSIRMEPVFMVLGHSAAVAASHSIEDGVDLHDIDYAKLREQLLAEGQHLEVDTEQFPPFEFDGILPDQRRIHNSEPDVERCCIVERESV